MTASVVRLAGFVLILAGVALRGASMRLRVLRTYLHSIQENLIADPAC